MDNTDTLLEAGLGFTADFDKPGGFIGMEAVRAQKAQKRLRKRLVGVQVLDPEPMVYHGDLVLRDGAVVGDLRAASYGHTLGGGVGLSMVAHPDDGGKVTPRWLREGAWEVESAGVRYPAMASLKPLYDPDNSRIKG
mmetsp:Transcript_3736/g.10733  ORF Transcript_3736/g.10733 Transcript_3736/m.10733 type:complete len:137 (-) Transcript_3736:185-595(-)